MQIGVNSIAVGGTCSASRFTYSRIEQARGCSGRKRYHSKSKCGAIRIAGKGRVSTSKLLAELLSKLLSELLSELQPILFHSQEIGQSFVQSLSFGLVVWVASQLCTAGKHSGFGDFYQLEQLLGVCFRQHRLIGDLPDWEAQGSRGPRGESLDGCHGRPPVIQRRSAREITQGRHGRQIHTSVRDQRVNQTAAGSCTRSQLCREAPDSDVN